jgi:ABC-type transport system substrate-binding protein
LRLTCILPSGFSIYERVALELQHQLFEIGVDLQFEVLPVGVYTKRTRAGDFEASFVDMISAPSLGRPYLFWRSAREGRGYNVFGYENPEAEALFQTLRASTTDQSVRSATHRLQRVFLQDPPAIFLAWNERSRAVRHEFGVPEADAAAKTDPLLSLWHWGADKRSETPIAR